MAHLQRILTLAGQEFNFQVYHTTFQVSTKQSELGIGQIAFKDYRFKLVDYLPPMYMFEDVLASKKPTEITSYDTIIIPFDKYVWSFLFGCICAQFLLLVIMQHLYSNVTGTSYLNDFIYEGNINKCQRDLRT